jgi:hypothetical protein
MTNSKAQVERRKHKRFRVEHGAYVICQMPDIGAGRLINISMNGLGFEYVSSQPPSIDGTELEIYLGHGGFRLYGIPYKPLWDLVTHEVPAVSLRIRQCGTEFGELTPQQASQLEYFIQHHTISEAQA